MANAIDRTIAWHVSRSKGGEPRIRQLIATLMLRHKLTRTQAEDAITRYAEGKDALENQCIDSALGEEAA